MTGMNPLFVIADDVFSRAPIAANSMSKPVSRVAVARVRTQASQWEISVATPLAPNIAAPTGESRMRTWWASLEVPFKIALLRHAQLPVQPAMDNPSDEELQAVLEVSELYLVAADGIPTSFEPLAVLPELVALALSGPGFPYATLSYLPDLTALRLEGASDLHSTGFLVNLPFLKELTIFDARELDVLEGLQRSRYLRFLQVQDSYLRDLTCLLNKPLLRFASLMLASNVRELGPLADLSSLEELHLRADRVASLAPLRGLTKLQRLSLGATNEFGGTMALRSLSGLQGKPLLRVVEIRSAPLLEDVSALAQSASLQGLSLEGCCALTDLASLGTLSSLKELDLTQCKGISDVRFATQMPSLEELSIAQTSVADLSALGQCAELKALECWDMQATPIQGLAAVLALPQLCELTLQAKQFPKAMQWRLRRDYGYLLSRD